MLLVVAGVVVMIAAAAGGLRLAGIGAGPSAAEQEAAALKTFRGQIQPGFSALMGSRTRFFAAERRYLPAMKEAKAKIADSADSPDAPDLSPQVSQLNRVTKSMTSLHAELIRGQPIAQLAPAHAHLLSAVDALRDNAKKNASILTEAVSASEDAEGNGGYVDKAKLRGLNGNDALTSIRRMNRSLIDVLKTAQLLVGTYDLPGGQDVHPGDDSMKL